MIKTYYPLFLDLESKTVLVIGAGEIASRKAQSLLRARARVTVVGPHPIQRLIRLGRRGRIRLLARPFQSSDLAKAAIVVAATNDEHLNRRVSIACQRRRIWVNVVDRPPLCSFIVPSVIQRGRLTVAISTGGLSPALSKWLRKTLEKHLGHYLSTLLQDMASIRKKALRKLPAPKVRLRILSDLLHPSIVGLYQRGKSAAGKRNLVARFESLCAQEGKRP